MMSTIDVAGKTISLLSDGRLKEMSEWDEAVASALAARENITLEDDHWIVINFMRQYYSEYNISPVKKLLKRGISKQTESDKFNNEHLAELFPGGVLIQASKISGVPIPYLDAELERDTYAQTKSYIDPDHREIDAQGHFVGEFKFEDKTYPVTEKGNLISLHCWSEKLAIYMAKREGIELEKDHWDVLNFLRKFYFEYGTTPMVRILMKHMADEFGEKNHSKEYLYQLFPKGPSRQGSRIAGLPEPQGCIDP